MIEPT